MSVGDAQIMLYGPRENVNLTRSIEFITITVSTYHQEAKTIEFIQCLINLRGRPKDVLIAYYNVSA